jgi:peptidoglycan/LPS O-acetylase OafA/YrhL
MQILTPENKRINLLDSFRCLAVLLVILIHLGSSYSEYYPYGNQLSSSILIANGHLGVHLFFMISGFVIFMTLERCKSFVEFIIKRITRLLPTLLFCCLLTYSLFAFYDAGNHFPRFHNSWMDFIPSLTFTDLWIWNKIFHKQFEYIDGVYWTLAYEMKFYILAAVSYYINKKHFFTHGVSIRHA